MKTKNNRTNLVRLAMMLVLAVMTSVTAWAANVTLSGSNSYTVNDGDVLTGSTNGTVTIADGAKITLNGVTINGGIVCAGTAEITLAGTNSVTGPDVKPTIHVMPLQLSQIICYSDVVKPGEPNKPSGARSFDDTDWEEKW